MNASPNGGVHCRSISSKQHHRYRNENGKHAQGHTKHDDAGRNPRQELFWMEKRQRQEREPKEDWYKTNKDQNIGHISTGDRRHLRRLTVRLSDAGLRRCQTKLIYPNHRLPPWLTKTRPRDRSNRLLDATQRSRDRGHRSCNSLRLPQHHRPRAFAHHFVQFFGNLRFRGNTDRDCEFNVDLEYSADSVQPRR